MGGEGVKNEELVPVLERGNLAVEFGHNVCFYGFGDKEEVISEYFNNAY